MLFPGAKISEIYRKGENALDIRINSRIVADFLRTMGIVSSFKSVPSWIAKDFDYSKACIRGLIDAEGLISFKIYKGRKTSVYKQLIFRNYNISLMRFMRNKLIDLGLKPTTSLKHSLYLSNNVSIKTYRDQIGFSNPKLLKRSFIKTHNDYLYYLKQP